MAGYCPDAPYIREAELCGMPSPETVYCPICDKKCETIYKDINGYMIGCNACVKAQDSWEWMLELQERNRPDWADR